MIYLLPVRTVGTIHKMSAYDANGAFNKIQNGNTSTFCISRPKNSEYQMREGGISEENGLLPIAEARIQFISLFFNVREFCE